MSDFINIFDVYLNAKVSELDALQANTDSRLTGTAEQLRRLEFRYERMSLVTNALWQLIKEHTGLTDGDLKRFVEKVDLQDGKLDGRLSKKSGAMDCPRCSRRMLKSALICPWCGSKSQTGDPFQST